MICLWSFRLCYVQSLAGHKSPVTAVSASETTGDIATVCDSGEQAPKPKHRAIISWFHHKLNCWVGYISQVPNDILISW